MADYTLGHQMSGSLLSDVDADLRLGGLDKIKVDSTVGGRVDSDITAKADAKVDATAVATVNSDSDVRTNSDVRTDSRVASSVDLAPVAVESSIRVELGSLPPTEVHTPWEHRLGFSVLGVELFAWVLSGRTTTTLRPVPKAAQLIGSVEQVGDGHGHGEHGSGNGHGEHGHGEHGHAHGPSRSGSHVPGQASSGGLSIRLG